MPTCCCCCCCKCSRVVLLLLLTGCWAFVMSVFYNEQHLLKLLIEINIDLHPHPLSLFIFLSFSIQLLIPIFYSYFVYSFNQLKIIALPQSLPLLMRRIKLLLQINRPQNRARRLCRGSQGVCWLNRLRGTLCGRVAHNLIRLSRRQTDERKLPLYLSTSN